MKIARSLRISLSLFTVVPSQGLSTTRFKLFRFRLVASHGVSGNDYFRGKGCGLVGKRFWGLCVLALQVGCSPTGERLICYWLGEAI